MSIAKTPQSHSSNYHYQLDKLVNNFISNNPTVKKTQAAVQAAEARLDGSVLPLNNPELTLGSERTSISTLTLGISQTLDWYDKQSSLEQIARTELIAAKLALSNTKLDQTSQFLKTFGDITAFNEITTLSKQRVEILSQFNELASQRFQAGDISQTELQLARLSLTEAIMQHASNGAELLQAKSDFFALNGSLLNEAPQFPENLPSKIPAKSDLIFLAKNHPEVKFNLQKSIMAKQQIMLIDSQRKIDPSIGLTAGQEGNQSLIGLSFSIPLSVRNDFSSNVKVAQAEAIQAEQEAQQAYRTLLSKIQGSYEQYNLVAKAWLIWVDQGKSSLQQRIKLLDIQWQAGEMNTTDYLIQLQQTIDTKITGAKLHNSLWQSWINWLSNTNTLANWLTTNSLGEKQ